MSTGQQGGVVLLLGAEPAAFSCALELVESGLQVRHIYPEPLGLLGASRDIGLAYPELGEPWERLAYSLGPSLALEYHDWSKSGIEDLSRRLPELITRGSRLSLGRTDQESKLLADDAVVRSKAPVGDELRLMSGAAVSNYAPVDGATLGSFETHCIAFAPIPTLQALQTELNKNPKYHLVSLKAMEDWKEISIQSDSEGINIRAPKGLELTGDLCVVGAGLETAQLLSRFQKVLVPIEGQAFRTASLRESTRSSVVGISASWGYERYRFDSEYRLLGCGVDPSGSGGGEPGTVNGKVMGVFLKRACQLFTDFEGDEQQLMQWAVQFDGTCDGLPLLGPLPGQPNIQVLAGFALSAWSRGWEAGRQLAKAIAARNGEKTSPLLERCTVRRFAL